MIILIPDATGTVHICDTAGGLVQFIPGGGATSGTIVYNGTVVMYAPTSFAWQLMQQMVVLATVQNAKSVSFASAVPPGVFGINQTAVAGGQAILTGVNFQTNCSVGLDVGSGPGSALPFSPVGVVNVTPSQLTINLPPTSAGVYTITVFNPDGGFCVFPITTS